MSRTLLAAGLAGVLLLSACTLEEPAITANDQVPASQRTEEVPEGEEVAEEVDPTTFVAIDIEWEAAPAELPAGDVTVTLVNDGSIEHNLVIEALGASPVAESAPGETTQAQLTLEPGTYSYFCDVPGHEVPMSGEFTVA